MSASPVNVRQEFEPYRPPWYPFDDNPWEILSSMSGDVVTRYQQWVRSLPEGELKRLVREYRDRER
jgi:hypothetical protein